MVDGMYFMETKDELGEIINLFAMSLANLHGPI